MRAFLHRGILRRGLILVLGSGIILTVSGCARMEELVRSVEEEEWTPEETTIAVHEDGSLTEVILDTLDRDYYSSQELEDMITASVEEFNAQTPAQTVTVDEFLTEGNQIRLTMSYPDSASYAAYNHVPFFNGSMLSAQMEGFRFDTAFRKVTDGALPEETISDEEPLSHKEYRVAVSDLSHAVRVPGEVRYVSENALLPDSRTAVPDPAFLSSAQEGLVLPSSAVYVGETQAAEEDPERSYLYVIYE